MILVSVGGGRLGHDMLECIVKTAPFIDKYLPHHIQIFTGPFMPDDTFSELQKLAADTTNVTIRRYTPQLLAYMEKAALSISLAGYNTTMNILRTGVRAMVLPSDKDQEQIIRAQKLEKLGILEVIRPSDLKPTHFAEKIITCLNKELVVDTFVSFELQGAQKTAALLKELLQSKGSGAYAAA